MHQIRSQFLQRTEDKGAFMQSWMGQGQPGTSASLIVDQQQVDIKCSRAPTLLADPTQLLFDLQTGVKQRLGRQVSPDGNHGIQIVGLACRPPHGSTLIEPGTGKHLDPRQGSQPLPGLQ